MASTLRLYPLAVVLTAIFTGCAESAPKQDSAASSVSPLATRTALADAPDVTLTRDGVTINYRSIGSGDPVLLIHGYGDNLKMWAGLADSIATTHRVIAVDARGFGRSSKPAGVTNYGQAMVADLVALLDTTGSPTAHVVGYSMGAILAASLALSHPERVRTVTLAAGAYHKNAAAMRAMTRPWIEDLEHGRRLTTLIKQVAPAVPDSQVKTFSDQIFAEGDSAALEAVLQSFADLSIDWSKVSAAKIPAVVIVGADDPLRPYSRDLAARWPGAKHVEIPAMDHVTIPGSPRLFEEVRLLVQANAQGASR
jgi:pimeloyl-ACP methyl ester carboxylesterase